MTEISGNRDNLAGGGDEMQFFYAEISSIQESIRAFNDSVQKIGDLHQRSLNNMDDQAVVSNSQQLTSLVEETRKLSTKLKNRIKTLEQKAGSGPNASTKRQQTGVVRHKFMEAIQNYQNVEKQFRTRYKQRMERQFKIGQDFYSFICKCLTLLSQTGRDVARN
jgi:syntaxin 1B/2/3